MVNLAAVDLNLLVVLHHVLVERSATRAARRLGVTQSAVSNALARLRELFDDPLVVRHARGLAPTPRGLALAPRVARFIAEAAGLLEDPGFDLATTAREFTLACADYYGMLVVPPLAEALRQRAPRASLRVVTLERLVSGGGLAEDVDVHVGRPPTIPAGCRTQPLFDERFVCVTRREPRAAPRMSMREYAAAQHIRVRVLDSARDPIDAALQARGVVRSIALTVPHFSLAPLVVLNTGWVATMSERLARLYASFLPLTLRQPPFALAAHPVQMLWHQRTHDDPAAQFFRALVAEISQAAPATARPRGAPISPGK